MNPTGSVFLSANQNYLWQDGDVYQIAQTDTVEAAASGASFNGLGVANQPHQTILNKLNLIHANQLIDETTLTALNVLSFTSGVGLTSGGAFSGSGNGRSGWLKVSASDQSLGSIHFMLQWGVIDMSAYAETGTDPATSAGDPPNPFSFNFPVAFPNAATNLSPWWEVNGARSLIPIGISVISPLQPLTNQILFTSPGFTIPEVADILGDSLGGSFKSAAGAVDVGWIAIGF